MSAETYRAIRCNAPAAGEVDGQCSTEWGWPFRVDTHTELRRLLADRGWHARPGGRDICPDCWAAGHR